MGGGMRSLQSVRGTLVAMTLGTVMLALPATQLYAQDRGGFTFLVDIGAGVQNDTAIDESAAGLAGLNFGIGGFLNQNLALLFRIAGTNVSYELSGGDYGQTSGVIGTSLQYWLTDRFNVEAGAGVGFWNGHSEGDEGLGLLLGAAFSVFNRGKHNVQVGAQYVPAFTSPGAVHNFGFTVGYQFE